MSNLTNYIIICMCACVLTAEYYFKHASHGGARSPPLRSSLAICEHGRRDCSKKFPKTLRCGWASKEFQLVYAESLKVSERRVHESNIISTCKTLIIKR